MRLVVTGILVIKFNVLNIDFLIYIHLNTKLMIYPLSPFLTNLDTPLCPFSEGRPPPPIPLMKF